jgi:O-antigen/teichoic acid export membrane protein
MQPAKRVIRNTGFLYGKTIITIFISLYSTRLILNALGVADYGIFTLIGGVIAMLSFINGAMIIATQRYLSISLGAGDTKKLKSVFGTSVLLHLIIGFSIVILLEIGGLFLFNGWLNIPPDRLGAARMIFHFMVVSTFFTINAVPYDASINSHENMVFDAILGIFESCLKLGIAIILIYVVVDKLILYGLLMASMTIALRLVKSFYCFRKYEECRVRFIPNLDIKLLKEMISFAGWNLLGLFCSVLKTQGLAILLNLFFGIVVNAAYGIANQVNSNIRVFSTNMIRAVMPQITKSEGSGNRERMLRLSIFASKMSFFLFAFFAIPIFIEMPFVLKIWLKQVPENSIIFCQLILILTLMWQITVGTMASVTSVGNIKAFQIAVATIEIFSLPLSYGLIKLGLPVYFVFIGLIFMELIASGFRTWYAHKIAGLDIKDFFFNTWLRSMLSAVIAGSLAFLTRIVMPEGFIRAILVAVTSTLAITLLLKYYVLNPEENEKIRELVLSIYFKTRKKIRNHLSPASIFLNN